MVRTKLRMMLPGVSSSQRRSLPFAVYKFAAQVMLDSYRGSLQSLLCDGLQSSGGDIEDSGNVLKSCIVFFCGEVYR